MSSQNSTTGNVLGTVGAAVGFYVGGPMGAAYGYQIGSGVGNMLDPPKGPTMEGPRLSDLSVQTSTYGAFIPRVYGTVAQYGNVFWLENNALKEVVKKKKSGGKGGGSSTTTKTYSYFATFAVGLCQGPIEGIRRIWIGPNLVYDPASTDRNTIIASSKFASKFTLYKGDDTQLPDSRMQADLGAANTPAYRGLAYLVIRDLALANYGNSMNGATVKVEIVKAMDEITPSLWAAIPATIGVNERICYADESVFQTAEAETGYVDTGAAKYFGAVNFKTYTYDGALIGIDRQVVSIATSGTNSLTFYKSLYLSGAKSMAFAYRASGTPLTSLSSAAVTHMAAVAQDATSHRGIAGGYYWLFGGANQIRLNSDTATEYTITGARSQSVVVVEDPVTGRCYRRWCRISDNNSYLEEFDPETLEVIWQSLIGTFSAETVQSFSVRDGIATIHRDYALRVYDVSGTSAVELGAYATATRYANVYPFAPEFAAYGTSYYRTSYSPSIDKIPLAEIVQDECVSSGLLSLGDIDTTLLTDEVTGYRVTSVGSIRNAIEPLRGAFPFDVIQSGYKIKFITRGQSSIADIDAGELGADEQLRQVREMDSQMPNELLLKYLDKGRDYDANEAHWERIGTAVNTRTIDMPAVLTADEAAQIVERLGNVYWLERTTFGPFTLPPTRASLEPADVISLHMDYADYELRLTSVNYKSDGSIECSAAMNNASTYISTAVADAVTDDGTVPLDGLSVYRLLDIPVVDEALQNSPGIGAVMAGYSDGWTGGQLFSSADNGQVWVDLQGFAAGSFGTTQNPLGAHDGSLIDQSTLTVYMLAGTLESITRDQMLTGVNACAYGADGRWEIMHFQNAALNSDGSYTLSDFWRGDKGTEWATGLHEYGDAFVLLDDPDTAFIGLQTSSIGSPRVYRGITNGQSIETDTDTDFTYQGVNLMPLSPVYAKATRDGSGNLSATFTRRSRLSGSWWTAGVETVVGETSQAYEIDVMSGATVKRTIAAVTPSFSYSAANQTTDFGSAQSSITFRIYQLSETVGRGYVREVIL